MLRKILVAILIKREKEKYAACSRYFSWRELEKH
jgi:hypothetical protein